MVTKFPNKFGKIINDKTGFRKDPFSPWLFLKNQNVPFWNILADRRKCKFDICATVAAILRHNAINHSIILELNCKLEFNSLNLCFPKVSTFKKIGNQFNFRHGSFIKRIDLMCPWCFWLYNALDYTRFTCTWLLLTNISKSHVSLMFGPKQYPMADFQSPLHHTAPVTDGTSSVSYVFHKYPKILGWNPIQFTSPSLR